MSGTITYSSSSASLKVLSASTLDILRARGEGFRQGGYRAVSNTSYASQDSLDSEATVLIPDELESLKTFRFLEFNHTTALILWERYRNGKIEFPEWSNVVTAAKAHVRTVVGYNTTSENDNEWVNVMRRIGLSSNFQARIMKPEWRSMRLAGSLKTWIWELFEARYDFLRTLDSVLQTPPFVTLGRKTSKPSLGGSFTTKAAPPIPARVSSQVSQEPKFGFFSAQKPSIATAAAEPPKKLDGHIILLKGIARPRLDHLFKPDGRLEFQSLISRIVGDFNKLGGLYFRKDYEVAWRYAQWAQNFIDGNIVPVEILHVAVPQHLLASSRELCGNEWRGFVWGNRRDDQYVPTELEHLDQFCWLIGPVCHSPTERVERMRNFSELEIWKLPGNQTASQFFTASLNMMAQMDSACIGKVWRTAVEAQKKK